MIDLHTHVLPGVDDGAKSMDEALAMLRAAAEAGTTDIVASPHANARYVFDAQRTAEGAAELGRAGGKLPRVHCGCELNITPEGIEAALDQPGRYSIAGSKYLLVEFSDVLVPRNSGQILGRLVARGLRPIIVHPERNPLLQRNAAALEEWIGGGCLVQITGQSLLGRFGARARGAAREWVERGLVHFVASDGHDASHRPAELAESWKFVESSFGGEIAARLMVENPGAVLENRSIRAGAARPRRHWWFLRG